MSESLPESLIPKESADPDMLETRPRPLVSRGQGDRLAGRIALITDGATGIGQAVAVAFAQEGAQIVIAWLNEHESAAETVALIEAEGSRALSIPGDIGNPDFATELVRQAVAEFGRIDILVNAASEQHACARIEEMDEALVERSFRTNILGQIWLAKAALPHLAEGGCIINTSAASACQGDAALVDFAASAAAVIGFTRSLALQLAPRGIRVNAVAPASGQGAPGEIAPFYVFLASPGAGLMTGQMLHPHGGAAPA